MLSTFFGVFFLLSGISLIIVAICTLIGLTDRRTKITDKTYLKTCSAIMYAFGLTWVSLGITLLIGG